MSSNQHLSQFNKIAMILIINFDCSPRISSTPHLSLIRSGVKSIGSNYRERDLALLPPHHQPKKDLKGGGEGTTNDNLIILSHSFLILVIINGGPKDLNPMKL